MHLNVAIMEASDLMAVSLAQATVLTVSVLLVKTYFYAVVVIERPFKLSESSNVTHRSSKND